MIIKIIVTLLVLISPLLAINQETYSQYFDGADTSAYNSIIVHIDTSVNNCWQIGHPQKAIFDSAATFPNAIVTDTVNNYTANNLSKFQFTIIPWTNWGILAIQWMQKLDMDSGLDGGVIDFSVDGGFSWQNAFDNPFVYNFYGYDSTNVDTLQTGEIAFTGTDSTWKNIWLCYDMTWLSYNDSIMVRYSFKSDSVNNSKEGWMMDNMLAHITIIHTVNEANQEEYIKVFPNPTTGRVEIQARKIDALHIIEKMELINMSGRVVQEYGVCPTKFFIDLEHLPSGIYTLNIQTNIQKETFKIMLQ